MSGIPFIETATLMSEFGYSKAISAITETLELDFDPEKDLTRNTVEFRSGHGLVMPSELGDRVGLKFVTVAPQNSAKNLPRIQGIYTLLDAQTLTPILQCDGAALTLLRTASVTAAVVKKLTQKTDLKVAIFGSGPQAISHAHAVSAATGISEIYLLARNAMTAQKVVDELSADGFAIRLGTPLDLANADLVLTATTSATPLFSEDLVSPTAVIAAVGSHEPAARELPGALLRTGSVFVESKKSALLEAGDILLAIQEGHLKESDLIGLSELFRSPRTHEAKERKIYKSTGMSWQDLSIMSAVEAQLGY